MKIIVNDSVTIVRKPQADRLLRHMPIQERRRQLFLRRMIVKDLDVAGV